MYAVEVTGLQKTYRPTSFERLKYWLGNYPEEKRRGTLALQDVSFKVEPGKIVSIVGPNGSGKTTFITLVGGINIPDKGSIRVFGRDPQSRWVKENTLWSPDNAGLYPHLPAKASFRFQLGVRGYFGEELKRREDQAIQLLLEMNFDKNENLVRFVWSKKKTRELSKGQKRKAALALDLACDPQLILLDEPTDGLDVAAQESFWRIMQDRAKNQGMASLIVTHDGALAESKSDELMLIRNGRLIFNGKPNELEAGLPPEVRCLFNGEVKLNDVLRKLASIEREEQEAKKRQEAEKERSAA